MIFSELLNYSSYALVVILYSAIKRAPFWLLVFLLLLGITPFYVNDFLFPIGYMPDQIRYLDVASNIREGTIVWGQYTEKVEISGLILAFMPIPYIDSVYSLALVNRLLASLLILWLYSTIKIRGLALIFLLIYPSFILYSAVALRDTIILIIMMYAFIAYINKKRILAFVSSFILYFIKIQNFFLMVIFFLILETFSKENKLYKYKFSTFTIFLLITLPFMQQIIEIYNFYSRAMFFEDGGRYVDFTPITSIFDVISRGPIEALYFLMKPFPWEASNLFQGIQSIENIIILYLVWYLFNSSWKIDRTITFRWFLILMTGCIVYGMVVSNYGTASRYRFSILLPIIMGLSIEVTRMMSAKQNAKALD